VVQDVITSDVETNTSYRSADMIDPHWFVEQCRQRGVTFYTGVPDSLLKSLNQQLIDGLPRDCHVIAANEGAAVGIAIGHYLATGHPAAVYLQNSGFGNAVNPLLSLADREVYGVPMLLLVGWRGRPGEADEPQHGKQGRVMAALLDALELPWSVLPGNPAEAAGTIDQAVTVTRAMRSPYVLLVGKDTFGAPAAPVPTPPGPVGPDLPAREEALIAVVETVGPDAVFVSTTGMLSRELFEYRERTGPGRDFLVVGGMGHASSIALGLAMREPRRDVWCLDGDGALLMHLGSLAVIADRGPANLFHVVFNNGVHDSVGGQPTSIGTVDVPSAARMLGYRHALTVSGLADAPAAVVALRDRGGPALLDVRVRPGSRPGLGRPPTRLAGLLEALRAELEIEPGSRQHQHN
jgi:phosphonopyruvate decarboxylase